MIQLEDIRIREFRGIRDLLLRLNCGTFVIYGPNGSGKSGVVDAIEFVLTGAISRLSGAGLGNVSLAKHGTHVLRQGDPGAAVVSATIKDTISGKTALLTRCIKTPKSFTLAPDDPEIRAAVEAVKDHSEIALSRREIIRYIITEPTKRSQEVQVVLKLDRLNEIRSSFRTAQTQIANCERSARERLGDVEGVLQRHLELSSLEDSAVLIVINKQRGILGLAPLGSLDGELAFTQGAAVESNEDVFNKASAVRSIEQLVEVLGDPKDFVSAAGMLTSSLRTLEDDPAILDALQHRSLVAAGLVLTSSAFCPLCDTEWASVEVLRSHLAEKIERSKQAAALENQLEERRRVLIGSSRSLRERANAIRGAISACGSESLLRSLKSWSEDLLAFETRLETLEGTVGQQSRIAGDALGLPADMLPELLASLDSIRKIPDQTATVNARSYLVIAQNYYVDVLAARTALIKNESACRAVRAIYTAYCATSDEELAALYRSVEDDFSSYYRDINSDDESSFKVELKPSAGKLDLAVDFHGTGMVPPAAYHSEGHQDGMGVCLYLALMKRLLGADFRFVVLDDVVMSVDSGHRKRFCDLLVARFPDVQFIITTHDENWAYQLVGSGLIKKSALARFHSWSVESGPIFEEPGDFWDRINLDLEGNDVPAAAARLRRNLEMTLADTTASLRGSVVFKPHGRYELGDYLSATNGAYTKLLGRAMKSATYWGNADQVKIVEDLQNVFKAVGLERDRESWAVNSAVHFNEWANLGVEDFKPVVDAWKSFLSQFVCANSGCGVVHVVGEIQKEEALRCACGRVNLNLSTSK